MRWAVLALLCVTLAACGPSGDPVGLAASLPAPAANQAAVQGQPARADYRISKDDTLEIIVFQVADLSRTVQVDGSGQVLLPLLGQVPAAGKTVREFEADVTRRLGAKYLQNPQVWVSVKDAAGQRVIVDGAVKKPAVFQASGQTTLLWALTQAGGLTDTADTSGVMVFRVTEKGRMGARFDVSAIRSGQAADPPIYGGDTIIVDESGAKTAWKGLKDTLPVAGFFRFLVL